AQVAVERCRAALGGCEEIVPARLRNRLPVAGPGLVGGADGKRRRAHQPRAALEGQERAVANRKEERLAADIDPAFGGEPASTTQQVGVGSKQARKASKTI